MSSTVGRREAGEGSTRENRKNASPVWDHFTIIDTGTRASCKYCRTILNIYENSKSTTNFLKHLRGKSAQVPDDVRKLLVAQKKMPRASNVRSTYLDNSPVPPPYEKNHQGVKEKLISELGSLTSLVSFSIEIMKEKGWISITAHFIDNNFKLVKKLIGLKKLSNDSSNVTDIIHTCISVWKLENKIFSFTIRGDNLRLFIQSKYERENLSYWYDMPLSCFKKMIRQRYFDNLNRECSKEKIKIVQFFNDALGTDIKRLKFNQIAKGKGVPPIEGKWLNCTTIVWDTKTDLWEICCTIVEMFKDALRHKEVFAQCARTKIGEAPFSDIDLGGIDWQKLEKAVECFETINPITDLLFNFTYPTANMCFQSGIEVQDKLNPYDKFKKLNQYDKFEKLNPFYKFELCPPIFYVACVLDPRRKLMFLKYFLKEVLSPEQYKNEVAKFRGVFQELLCEYEKQDNKQVSPVFTGIANTQEDSSSRSSTNENPSTIINRFSLHKKELETPGKLEMNRYLAEKIADDTEGSHFELLDWWKKNGSHYPILSRMARDVLAIPACVYSVEENLYSHLARHKDLPAELVEAHICSEEWIS